MHTPDENSLRALKSTIDRLRSPGGCPWDLEQTSESLTPYLLEEAHETVEAIEAGDRDAVREELGDLLLNIFLQARIAEEAGEFTLDDIADGIREKLIRRHPHVFGDSQAEDAAAVREQWEEIKRREKPDTAPTSALRPLPASLPAFEQAERVGKMAAETGFDWPDLSGPLAKVDEELGELRRAIATNDRVAIEAELGDLLLALSSVCRHLDLRGDKALRGALDRFRQRFHIVEARLASAADSEVPLAQLEAWWQQAKEQLDEGHAT